MESRVMIEWGSRGLSSAKGQAECYQLFLMQRPEPVLGSSFTHPLSGQA